MSILRKRIFGTVTVAEFLVTLLLVGAALGGMTLFF